MIGRLLERNVLPDALIRAGIRRLLRRRLTDELRDSTEEQQKSLQTLVDVLKTSEIAVQTRDANSQHYEVPTEFFKKTLGKHLKYSCGLWRAGDTLDSSELRMLTLTCERAQLVDGLRVLELGCGWGSLTLFMAERFPNSRITAVSNSRTQKLHIDEEISRRGLKNVEVLTADMNTFEAPDAYDRVVSVEMFEHMRNYERLLEKVSRWMAPEAKLFVHIFTHREAAYLFEAKDESDWMSKYFFSGGIMPSDHLLLYFQKHVQIEKHWRVSGTHYQKTSEAWLANMDRHQLELWPLFETTYGAQDARKWWVYWRVFFMSCAELWGFRAGNEWFVSHYLFRKKAA